MWVWARRAALVAGIALGGLALVLLGNTIRQGSRQVRVKPVAAELPGAGVAGRLAAAIRFQTVSSAPDGSLDAIRAMHVWLHDAYPRVHEALRRDVIADGSLLYTWTGSSDEAPIALLGHLDVVAVEDPQRWTVPPFEGRIYDGFVWGRGSLDDKQAVVSLLEAVEHLLARSFTPRRTVYLAFGHDEEQSGNGARAIVDELRRREVTLEFVLDEGGLVTRGVMAHLDAPLATVGIAEKGVLVTELRVQAPPGHASMPPKETAAGILARALDRVESKPRPGSLDGPTGAMFDYVGPELPLPLRVVFANRWLFGGTIQGILDRKPSSSAMIRTTSAVTVVRAGVQDNVLPSTGMAIVNSRIRNSESIASTLAWLEQVVADERVRIAPVQGAMNGEPSRVSSTDTAGFRAIQAAIREVLPGTVVAPFVFLAATDSRYYEPIATDVYRFAPTVAEQDDLDRVHGDNERISVEHLATYVQFYLQVLRRSAGARVD